MKYQGTDLIEQAIVVELDQLRKENEYLKECIRTGCENIKCAVCGEEIEHLSMQRMTRPILYHNKKCYTWKPRKIVKLEQEWEMDIVDILKKTSKMCGNINAQAEVLDLSVPYLYDRIRKYCADSLSVKVPKKKVIVYFMAENCVGKRKELYLKKIEKYKKS